ncbi:MAG: helix-turn-helix domain-containing protein [Thermodesulfobacteriota bacterium]|nr:helix-turn-helix domain-containing protein [Thermodesulfobacteriota bacterium]
MENFSQKALSPKEAAVRYSICPGTLANMRFQKKGPRFFKVGRKVLYKPQDIENWLFRNSVSTSDSVQSDIETQGNINE